MRFFIILLVVISCIGCNSVDKPKKPDNLISKDKMVDVMYDVFILNAAKGAHKITLEKNGIFPEDYVFEKHDIDSLQFALSNEYYGFQVEEYEAIIAKVEARINNNKEKYQEVIDAEDKEKNRQRDSIQKRNDSLKLEKARNLKAPVKLDYKDYPNSSKK